MKTIIKNSRRIHSYDFFRGILAIGIILSLTFHFLYPASDTIELFYRWVYIGFFFFFGLVVGQKFSSLKKVKSMIPKGIQFLALFLCINVLFQIPNNIGLLEFSMSVLLGDSYVMLSLLLPLGIFALLLAVFSYLPPFLGLVWSLGLFILLDLFSLQKDFLFLNAFYLSALFFGFYFARLFSLDLMREKVNERFSFFPFLALYIVVLLLFLGQIFPTPLLTLPSIFWIFHFAIVFLVFFSIPNTVFSSSEEKPKSSLRRFLEPLGIDILFIYVTLTLFLEIIRRMFPEFYLSSIVEISIFSIHLVILFFALLAIIHRFSRKNKKFKKCFRFLF